MTNQEKFEVAKAAVFKAKADSEAAEKLLVGKHASIMTLSAEMSSVLLDLLKASDNNDAEAEILAKQEISRLQKAEKSEEILYLKASEENKEKLKILDDANNEFIRVQIEFPVNGD